MKKQATLTAPSGLFFLIFLRKWTNDSGQVLTAMQMFSAQFLDVYKVHGGFIQMLKISDISWTE